MLQASPDYVRRCEEQRSIAIAFALSQAAREIEALLSPQARLINANESRAKAARLRDLSSSIFPEGFPDL